MVIIQVDREVHHQVDEDKVTAEAGQVLQETDQGEAGVTHLLVSEVKT